MLDPILRDLHIPLARGGVLSLGFFFGRLTGVFLLNVGLARVPLKWILVGAAWLQAVGLAVSSLFSYGLWSLFGALFVVGMAAVIPNAVPGMWVGAHVREGTERAMLLILVFFALGVVVAPLVIGAALGSGASWRWVFGGEALFSVGMALLLTAMPLADVPNRENLRLRHVRQVVGFAPGLLASMLAATLLYVGAESTFNVWLAKYQIDAFAARPAVAALAVTVFWAGIMVGRYGAIPLSRRFRSSRLLAAFSAILAAGAVGVAVSPSLGISEVFVFVAGLGASAIFGLVAGYTNRFPHWHAGVVYSWMILTGCLGSMLFPYLIGPLAHNLGFRLAMSAAAILAAGVILLSLPLHRAAARESAGG
ncbi:MAG: hypothetical protein H5T84_05200 [Thermoleophilia bacterium]|nr:hypothetical protein [Thermoleophilia bacterium]